MQMEHFLLEALQSNPSGNPIRTPARIYFSNKTTLKYDEADYQVEGATRSISVHVLGKWYYDETILREKSNSNLTLSNTSFLSSGGGWSWSNSYGTINPQPSANISYAVLYYNDEFTSTSGRVAPPGSPYFQAVHPAANTYDGDPSYIVPDEQFYMASFNISESDFVAMSGKVVDLVGSKFTPGIYITGSPNYDYLTTFDNTLIEAYIEINYT